MPTCQAYTTESRKNYFSSLLASIGTGGVVSGIEWGVSAKFWQTETCDNFFSYLLDIRGVRARGKGVVRGYTGRKCQGYTVLRQIVTRVRQE